MGGGKLATDTTYKQCFRLKTIDASDISHPIVHKEYSSNYLAIRSSLLWKILNNQVTNKPSIANPRR
jgi:hypothetical protein